ncbi:tyrosine-type recombinase/integrase [Thiohalocapsa marina]|uniref:tyrosine-type recombinase/integrase n=1 Tax=Thiohalocapsa marina TaxID=424902 RepID=UPI0036DDFF48
MAKQQGLTVRRVESAPCGKHADGTGAGLWLVVSAKGARRWFVRVVVDGKRREVSLGSYPLVSLAEAREKALEAQRLAHEGVDPIEHRQRQQQAKAAKPTFTQAAARYIRAHRHGWTNAKHARQWVSTLKTFARPVIGRKPVDAITTEDVLLAIKPIWLTKSETAKRVQGRIENILDYAAAHHWRDPVNPARWRGHLDKLLPSAAKVKRVEHHPAMPYTDVPTFMRELEGVDGVAALALRYLVLTACRTSEVLNARWSEVDLDSAVWTIPGTRMKAKREHRVPLTEAALAILRAVPRVQGEQWLFPGAKSGRPLSSMSLLMAMRRLGYGVNGERGAYVPHGFRSSFRDWCGEVTAYPREVAEAALAHVNPNKVEAAYQRSDLFAKRRKLMDDWSTWCGRSPAGVVSLDDRRRMTARN